jgi:hypothetical protein
MFSANADGLSRKGHSLKHQVNECNAAVFTIQETQFSKKGRFKCDNFIIFEAIRKNKEKGGTMIGIHKDLEPVLIEEYEETFELLVTEIIVGKKEIRIISGYGPQENWKDEDKMPFFVALEEEIIKAQSNGKSIVMELDSNSKLGQKYIHNDPNPMSGNGRIMAEIIERNGLCVANCLQGIVNGVITRKRVTKERTEVSAIDLVIISSDMIGSLVSVNIDEAKRNVLTRITKTKNGVVKKESDHNSIITKFNINWERKRKEDRIELFNFKDINGQKKFKELTEKSTVFIH